MHLWVHIHTHVSSLSLHVSLNENEIEKLCMMFESTVTAKASHPNRIIHTVTTNV